MLDLKVVRALSIARMSGRPVADIQDLWVPETLDDAYEVQAAVSAAFGHIVGWKVSAVSEMQRRQMGVRCSICAPLPARWMVASGGAPLSTGQFVGPSIECEYAFEICRDFLPRRKAYSREEVESAICGVRPAFEIVDSRLPEGSSTLLQVGDGFNNGGVVFGERIEDWRRVDYKNNCISLSLRDASGLRQAATGSGEAILDGDPVAAVVAMMNIRSPHHQGVHAGQMILTGTCTGAVKLGATLEARAVFPQLGEVSVRFTGETKK